MRCRRLGRRRGRGWNSAGPFALLALASLAWPPLTPTIAAQEPDSVEVTVTVRDAGSSEALAGVVIELSGLRERHITGDDGTATFEVPAGRYRLTVRKSGYETIERIIEDDLPVARAIRTIVVMRRPVEHELSAPASLLVQVTEFGSERPIEAAEVSLVGGSARQLTNARGMARFGDLRRSPVEVSVRGIGYATRTEPVLLEAGRTTLAKIAMTVEAVPLAPLEVVARSRFLEKKGVYWRIDHDRVTHLFDSDDLIERMRERGSPLLGHAFTRLPGLYVWYYGGGRPSRGAECVNSRGTGTGSCGGPRMGVSTTFRRRTLNWLRSTSARARPGASSAGGGISTIAVRSSSGPRTVPIGPGRVGRGRRKATAHIALNYSRQPLHRAGRFALSCSMDAFNRHGRC